MKHNLWLAGCLSCCFPKTQADRNRFICFCFHKSLLPTSPYQPTIPPGSSSPRPLLLLACLFLMEPYILKSGCCSWLPEPVNAFRLVNFLLGCMSMSCLLFSSCQHVCSCLFPPHPQCLPISLMCTNVLHVASPSALLPSIFLFQLLWGPSASALLLIQETGMYQNHTKDTSNNCSKSLLCENKVSFMVCCSQWLHNISVFVERWTFEANKFWETFLPFPQ